MKVEEFEEEFRCGECGIECHESQMEDVDTVDGTVSVCPVCAREFREGEEEDNENG